MYHWLILHFFLSLLIENIHIHYMYTVLKEVVEKERCLPNVCQIPVWDLSKLIKISIFTASVQSLSLVQLFATPWTAARQASLSITNSWSCLKLVSSRWWCHPTISSSGVPISSHLQSFPASGSFPVLRIRWPKYWRFSFSICSSNEYSGLISFSIDWFDLLAVQGAYFPLNWLK